MEVTRQTDLTPSAIMAALVGVESQLQIFGLQRWINRYREEPLLAILPGVALQELWQIVGVAEIALIGVSSMVVVTALLVTCSPSCPRSEVKSVHGLVVV